MTADNIAKTNRARSWLIILIFAGTALNYVDRQVLSLLKPTLQIEFGWNDQQFAHFGSTFQLTAAAALVFVGWFVDRFGVKIAYGSAVVVWSLAGIAHAFAATVGQFVGARMILAAAESVNTPAAVKAAAQYLPIKQRSMALGIVNTAPNIGNILTPLLIVPFAAAFGWKAAFVATGALGFVWFAAWIAGTRALTQLDGPGATTAAAKVDWSELLSDRKTWAIAGAKALTDMFWWFLTFWLPDLFHKVFNLSQAELGGPTALAFSLAALGALSSGALFPALLRRGLTIDVARKRSMLVFALLIVPIPFALSASNAWIAALIIGLGLYAHQGFSTNIFGLAADAIPLSRVASVMAVGAVAGNLAGFAIQEVTGALLIAGIGYWPLFAAAAVAYLLATLWVRLLIPEIKPTTEQ
jgi:MFS transporter, ACS family, hexuronate transporter